MLKSILKTLTQFYLKLKIQLKFKDINTLVTEHLKFIIKLEDNKDQ